LRLAIVIPAKAGIQLRLRHFLRWIPDHTMRVPRTLRGMTG
jgi:hypothetical protein